MRKGKDPDSELDPDPYLWLMDPDPGGTKTCGSRSPTLDKSVIFSAPGRSASSERQFLCTEQQVNRTASGGLPAVSGDTLGTLQLPPSLPFQLEERDPRTRSILLTGYRTDTLFPQVQSMMLTILKGDFLGFNYVPYPVLYSTLFHQPPLRSHCVGGCRDRDQDSCDYGIDCQTL